MALYAYNALTPNYKTRCTSGIVVGSKCIIGVWRHSSDDILQFEVTVTLPRQVLKQQLVRLLLLHHQQKTVHYLSVGSWTLDSIWEVTLLQCYSDDDRHSLSLSLNATTKNKETPKHFPKGYFDHSQTWWQLFPITFQELISCSTLC